MKPVFIPLKSQYFEAFKSGHKEIEYRRVGGQFTLGNCSPGREVTLSKGYGRRHEYRDEDGNWYDTHLVCCPMCLGTGKISGEATNERIREEILALRREGYDLP